MTIPADDARQGLDEIIAGVNRVCTSLAGVVTNATRAVEEQHARVAAAEHRAETAIRDAGIYRDRLAHRLAAHGKEATRANQAEQDAERFKADHLAACKTIADMHEAATGRTGMGPIRGVVEDVADVRHRAVQAEERISNLTHQVAELRRCNANQAQTIRDMGKQVKAAQETARVSTVAAHSLRLQTPDRAQRAIARIRDARDTTTVWTELGQYYGMTPEQAGQGAHAWRTTTERIAERHARRAEDDVKELAEQHDRHRRNLAAVFALSADTTTFEEITEYAARTLNRGGERLLASKARADRFEAAWQNARLRAQQAKQREQLARDRAERYRASRNHWTRQALDAAARNAPEQNRGGCCNCPHEMEG